MNPFGWIKFIKGENGCLWQWGVLIDLIKYILYNRTASQVPSCHYRLSRLKMPHSKRANDHKSWNVERLTLRWRCQGENGPGTRKRQEKRVWGEIRERAGVKGKKKNSICQLVHQTKDWQTRHAITVIRDMQSREARRRRRRVEIGRAHV